MSQPNVSEKKTRRRRDRIRRWFGIQTRSSPSVASNTITDARPCDPELGPARTPRLSGENLALPEITTPESPGGPAAGLVVPARHLSLSNTGLDTTPVSQIRTVSDESEAESLWARALSSLSEKDKSTLEVNETTPKLDIEELLAVVRAKRKMCLENQWEFELRGRAVNLRDQADKIISWLAKFKEVGDVAIQHDPSHAALPWAGFRFLLQMAVAERDQMGFLLTGVERLTNITSRCRIYEILYLDGIQSKEAENPIKPAFDHLSASLISLYKVVLQFLAKAFRAFSKSGIRRAQVATFNPGMFEGLAEQLQALDAEVVAAVGNCKEACNRNIHKDMGRLLGILKDLEEPVQRIDSGVKELLQNVGAKRRTEILQWVSAIPYEDNHNTACMGHTSGTGEWLLQHDTYVKWRTSPTCNLLWLHGIPGAGKTKLVSMVVSSLQRDLGSESQGEALAYFYCDRNQPDRQNHEQIMRSFVRQLSTPRESDMIPPCISECYTRKEKPGFASTGLTFWECCALVRELVRVYTKVTLVLDALDECDRSTRHKLINEIDKLVSDSSSSSCTIKVFISSRPDRDIKHRFQVGPNVCISATDNGEDIKKFLVDAINNSPPDWLEQVTNTHGLREEIINTLHEKANGMFQWAKLQMDQLLCLLWAPDIQDYLGKLPEDLERAYDEIMARINSQKGRTPEIARRALLWVMCSRRPLTPGMLADAVCQDPEIRTTNPIGIDINVVLEACCNLMMVDQSGVCRFSHLSVQEYLETRRYSNDQAHLMVGSVCLQMLLDPTNWQRMGGVKFSYDDRWEDKDLLRYTMVYWPDHVRLHAEKFVDDRLQLLVQEFLGSPNKGSPAYVCWSRTVHLYYAEENPPVYKGFSKSSNPAFAAVIFCLNQILCSWWTSNIDIDLQDDRGRSLLYTAGQNGNSAAAVELLDLGANPNAPCGEYGNALQAAARGGSGAIIRLLLDRGADIHAQGGNLGNALQAAAQGGSETVVRLLLDRGADINAQGGYFGNALQAAAFNGSEAAFCLLLDRGARINAQGGEYGTALQAAAWNGGEAFVRLLLDRGADTNAQGGAFGNALQAAARNGSEAVVCLLLDRGADINAQGGYFGNALQAATLTCSEAVVRLLLDRGADINAQGGMYGNALQAAARNGSEAVARLLLDRGADINAQGGKYGNALQAAAFGGSEAVVHLLLERGADINDQGSEYGNALQVAVHRGSKPIVRLLLDHGADVNSLEESYQVECRRLVELPTAIKAGVINQGSELSSEGRRGKNSQPCQD